MLVLTTNIYYDSYSKEIGGNLATVVTGVRNLLNNYRFIKEI
jgi:hypothetical protein